MPQDKKKKKEKKIQLVNEHSKNEDLFSKLCVKPFTTNKLLSEVRFHKSLILKAGKKLIITRLSRAFKDWTLGYAVKILDYRDLTIQLHVTLMLKSC